MSIRQVVALAAVSCVACCLGPIVGVLGGVAALGVVSTAWIGLVGMLIAASALAALFVVRRRRRGCVRPETETPVRLTTRPHP